MFMCDAHGYEGSLICARTLCVRLKDSLLRPNGFFFSQLVLRGAYIPLLGHKVC